MSAQWIPSNGTDGYQFIDDGAGSLPATAVSQIREPFRGAELDVGGGDGHVGIRLFSSSDCGESRLHIASRDEQRIDLLDGQSERHSRSLDPERIAAEIGRVFPRLAHLVVFGQRGHVRIDRRQHAERAKSPTQMMRRN